jgi:hypothetical protein
MIWLESGFVLVTAVCSIPTAACGNGAESVVAVDGSNDAVAQSDGRSVSEGATEADVDSAGEDSGDGDSLSDGDANSSSDVQVERASTCVTNSDCGPGRLCGFRVADGCTATGACFASAMPVCNAVLPGCACDGTFVNTTCNGLPSGYTSKPLLHTGACVSDGGSSE